MPQGTPTNDTLRRHPSNHMRRHSVRHHLWASRHVEPMHWAYRKHGNSATTRAVPRFMAVQLGLVHKQLGPTVSMETHVIPHCFKETGVVLPKEILSQREQIRQPKAQPRPWISTGKVREVGQPWGKMLGIRKTKGGESLLQLWDKGKGQLKDCSPRYVPIAKKSEWGLTPDWNDVTWRTAGRGRPVWDPYCRSESLRKAAGGIPPTRHAKTYHWGNKG